MPNRRFAAAIAACAALSGCSLGGDDEPKRATGAPKDIARTVERLDRATRAGDWRTICRELLSAAALKRAGGRDCERLTRETAGDIRDPDIRIVEIAVRDDGASVRVRTRSSGQAPAEDVIKLVREGGDWRIDSLAAG